MSKYFKPYLYFVYFLGILAFILSYSQDSIQFNISILVITIFIIVTEFKSISLSESSFLSLLSIFAVFSLTLVPVFTAIISLIIAVVIVDIVRVYIYKIYNHVFNIKSLFNLAMDVFCLYMAYLFGFVLIEIPILSLIVGVLVFTTLNKTMLFITLKLFDKKTFSMGIKKDQLYMFYYYILILLMLHYANLAYKEVGILVVLLFLVAYQTTALNKNNKGEIEKKLYLDNLTKANNRTSLNNDIGDKLLNNIPFCLIFFDFDNFKEINDKYSHSAGDKVLIHFVTIIQKEINAKLYRYGGDEFCLLLDKNDEGEKVLERINSLKESFIIDVLDKTLNYSVSYGKYDYKGGNLTIEELFYITSHNMHENKVEKKKTFNQ